jgi:ABC-type siderophore export system fused ATPase/permease subunit
MVMMMMVVMMIMMIMMMMMMMMMRSQKHTVSSSAAEGSHWYGHSSKVCTSSSWLTLNDQYRPYLWDCLYVQNG